MEPTKTVQRQPRVVIIFDLELGVPREAIVCAGDSEVLLRRAGENTHLLQPKTKLCVGGVTLVNSDMDNAQVTLTPQKHLMR